MAQNKYLDYQGLQRLVENINKKYAPISAIVFKSTVENIAALPAIANEKAGYMYNLKTGGITTEDFVEGAGHILADGENVAAVELMTGEYAKQTLAADADPKALGLYEIDTVTYNDVTATLDPADNPAALGLYEEDTLNPGEYVLTADTTVDPDSTGKHYFKQVVTYKLTQDRLPVSGKDYFKAGTVMKWDALGGLFDLEDRYLEFGDTFPRDARLVDGRTFLYMGNDTKVYTKVDTPEGRPDENGYFELDSATAVADPTTIYNPKQQDLYEKDETDPSAVFYVLSADVAYDDTKTYYECAFEASVDTTVDPAKIYYTEADQYKKAVIYQYDATEKDWIAQSSSGSGDMIPITNKEVDDLFI
jgi:hypothetical protein